MDACITVQVLLWSFPHVDQPPLALQTHHDLNIFGVEFLPGSGNTKVITAAYDRTVQLHDISSTHAPSTSTPVAHPRRRRFGAPQNGTYTAPVQAVEARNVSVYRNHSESVKVWDLTSASLHSNTCLGTMHTTLSE